MSAGGVAANNIASWDGSSWQAMGTGASTSVNALVVTPNGDLIAANGFTLGGPTGGNYVARWTGSAWAPLGAGFDGGVKALAVMPNGNLVAGGSFSRVGAVQAPNLAAWNGTAWTAIGAGTLGPVEAVAAMPNGDLIVGGSMYVYNGGGAPAASFIARRSGGVWSALGSGVNGNVGELAVLPTGELAVGGGFSSAGGVPVTGLARWDGVAWSSLGSVAAGPNGVNALSVLPNGDLLAGSRTAPPAPLGAVVWRWDGQAWSTLGDHLQESNSPSGPTIRSFALDPDDAIVVGGDFRRDAVQGQDSLRFVARWGGSAWSAIGGFNRPIGAFTKLPNGDLVAGGAFSAAGTVAALRVARWNGSSWSPLGTGLGGLPPTAQDEPVNALAVLPNGHIVAGGAFTTAGGIAATCIAKWDGSSWSPFGSGMSIGGQGTAVVYALAVMPNGDVVAGGNFTSAGGVAANHVARWTGTAWTSLGGGASGQVRSLLTMPNGDLVAGGLFAAAGGGSVRVARWDGATWSPVGNVSNQPGTPFALALLPGGDLVAGTGTGVMRWDGVSWSMVGGSISNSGSLNALCVLPNGDLVAGGVFTSIGGVAANQIARWNGNAWSPIGLGMSNWLPALPAKVKALALLPTGELAVGGDFTTAGSQVSAYFARYASPCPATVTATGAGCAGAGGVDTLAATTLPWTGATYRTRATGLAPLGVAAVVYGLSATSLPLGAALPPSPATCTLQASPDFVVTGLPVGGALDAQLTLPNTPSLAGTLLHQQVVMLEFDANLNFVQSTNSNALLATIGTF